MTSIGPRRSGLSSPARATAFQKLSSASRAPSAPPCAWPATRTAAFIAPAEVPEIPSMRSHGSSSRRSSTPHVKAPCAPPPCSAKSTRSGAWLDSTMFVILAHGYDGLLTCRADQDGYSCLLRHRSHGPLAARCALVTARPECVREGVSANSTGTRPTSSRRNRHGQQLETGDGRPKRHGAL